MREWLRDLIRHDPVMNLETQPSDTPDLGFEPAEALREADSQGLVRGQRHEYGHGAIWTGFEVTLTGLVWLGEWPRQGREHHSGTWDDGYWGALALPVLRRLAASGQDLLLRPLSDARLMADDELPGATRWDIFHAAERLAFAGYIDARAHPDYLDDVRVAALGRQVLSERGPDPLAETRAKLRLGEHHDAAVALRRALEQTLRSLAAAQQPPLDVDEQDRPRSLAATNDALKSAGIYDEPMRASVQAWAAVGNVGAHEPNVDSELLETAVAGAQVFFDRLAAYE